MIIFAGALAFAQSAVDEHRPPLAPSSQAAMLAGVRACIGSTVDPDGQAARVIGWSAVSPDERTGLKTDGAVVTRDDVLLIYKTRGKAGCVVLAQADGAFNARSFLTQVGRATGVKVRGTTKAINLPNGEIMSVQISRSAKNPASSLSGGQGGRYVVVAIANRAAEQSKHLKGN